MLRSPGDRPNGDARGRLVAGRALAGAFASLTCCVLVPASISAPASSAPKADPDTPLPVAGAFVYPVGDELDYTKAPGGSARGYYVSDPYLAERRAKGSSHQGVDLSNGASGAVVRSIASGVVTVADRNARVSVRKKERVTRRVLVKGKRVPRTTTRWRTSWKWRTGWGNYVVIRHILPNGETVSSLYAHLAPGSVQVRGGEIVSAGQPIGTIGRSGRVSSPHLHLEIRRSAPSGERDGSAFEEISTPEARHFARLETIDPLAFLDRHVRRYEDLDPGTWEARYALAACRDGLTSAEGERFAPREAMNRGDYYRALVFAFRLSSAFPSGDWESAVAALTDAGIVDAASAKRQEPDDKLTRSEALEILLRCLDGHRAHAHNLSSLDAMQVGRDFNRQFAGAGAAGRADRQAKALAAKETEARRRAAIVRAGPKGKKPGAAKSGGRSKRKAVRPVKPVPILDPGFESLAKSDKSLSRAEGCLLLATALRPGSERYSALQRAAIRIAQSE